VQHAARSSEVPPDLLLAMDPLSDAKIVDSWRKNATSVTAPSADLATANVALAAGTARTIVTADNNVGGAPLRAFLVVDR
jgi:hypothetical protein